MFLCNYIRVSSSFTKSILVFSRHYYMHKDIIKMCFCKSLKLDHKTCIILFFLCYVYYTIYLNVSGTWTLRYFFPKMRCPSLLIKKKKTKTKPIYTSFSSIIKIRNFNPLFNYLNVEEPTYMFIGRYQI